MTIDLKLMPNAPMPLDKKHADLKKATDGFESYFTHQLLVEMRKTVPKDEELKDDANQEETFRDMMDQSLADTMSKRGELGLGKLMYDQLSKTLGPNVPDANGDARR